MIDAPEIKLCVIPAYESRFIPQTETEVSKSVCITAINRVCDMFPDLLIDSHYAVYYYIEGRQPEPSDDTGFRFPKHLIDNTIERLQSKERMRETLENDLAKTQVL